MACVREGQVLVEYCDGSSYMFGSQFFCGPADGSSAGATKATHANAQSAEDSPSASAFAFAFALVFFAILRGSGSG